MLTPHHTTPPPTDAASLIPMDQIDAWVAEANHDALVNLIGALEHAPLDVLLMALHQACLNGYGSWLVPTDASTSARPATHLVEIQVLGVQGVGLTAEEAARNWRRAAVNLTQAEDAA